MFRIYYSEQRWLYLFIPLFNFHYLKDLSLPSKKFAKYPKWRLCLVKKGFITDKGVFSCKTFKEIKLNLHGVDIDKLRWMIENLWYKYKETTLVLVISISGNVR